jgi:Mn-dependent DtxR family transcriptional regulator
MKEIHESEEDYLEKILMLSYEMKDVRSIDLVKKMGFSKPSISVAVKNLEKAGKITRDDNGYITLTETGRQIAERIYARHILLTKLLVKLGIDEDEAVQEACRIEHDISQNTYEKLKKLADDYHLLDEDGDKVKESE